jgi:hypothetical protein
MVYRRYSRILTECLEAADRWAYSDLATMPVGDDELDSLALYTATSGGQAAVNKKRKEDTARNALQATAT